MGKVNVLITGKAAKELKDFCEEANLRNPNKAVRILLRKDGGKRKVEPFDQAESGWAHIRGISRDGAGLQGGD